MFLIKINNYTKLKERRIEKGAIEKSRKYFDIYEKLHDN